MVVRPSSRTLHRRKGSSNSSEAAAGTDTQAWTDRDDALLRAAVTEHGPKKWRAIAAMVSARRKSRRSEKCCRVRWLVLTNSDGSSEKRKWAPDEDALLIELAEYYDQENWALVASQLSGRSAKQCRERWQNQVRPDLNHGPWQPEEDLIVIAWQHKVGNKWAMIAKQLVRRTDNMVKNRWYSTLARDVAANVPGTAVKRDVTLSPARKKPKNQGIQPVRKPAQKRKRVRSSVALQKKKKAKTVQTESRVTAFASAEVGLDSPDSVDVFFEVVSFSSLLGAVTHFDHVGDGVDVRLEKHTEAAVMAKEKPEFQAEDVTELSAETDHDHEDRWDEWVPTTLLEQAHLLQLDPDPTAWTLVDEDALEICPVNDGRVVGDEGDHDDLVCEDSSVEDEFGYTSL